MEINELGFKIIDAHCHVATTDFTPRSFIDGIIDNIIGALSAQGIRPDRATLLEMYVGKLHDPYGDELVAEMDEAGIEKAILLLPDLTYALKDSKLTIAELFEHHRAILEKWPDRLLVFAGVDPRWGEDGIELFERGVSEYNFRGLKLYPPCGYSPSDKSLYPFYEICSQKSLPVLTHTGGTSPALGFDTARPGLVDQAARDFPNLNFILAHGSTSYVEECVMMCSFRPNVFLDVSGYEMLPLQHLKSMFSRGINHKIIFGSDWPIFRLQGNQKGYVEALLQEGGPLEGLRAREVHGFFRGTIERLINIT